MYFEHFSCEKWGSRPEEEHMAMFHMGRAKIDLIVSDITTQDVDVVVNPANNYLWMKTGVAGALKRVGGQEIEAEAMGKGPIPVGDVILTKAGNLPCRYIAHAAVMGQDLKTNQVIIKKAVKKVLEVVEEKKLKSMAFPAIGIGVGGLNPESSAKAMFLPMLELLPDSDGIAEVHVCFMDEDIRTKFRDVLLQIFSSPGE
jgi:O-acetyl-ADP-ribose deacetylase (regulator of RNase III)